MRRMVATWLLAWGGIVSAADNFPKPYSPPCTERADVFEFTQKPEVKDLGNDRYEITFTVKGYCDVTVGILDEKGVVARHLACGVLGKNAPPPFQKNSLSQKVYWDGKDQQGEFCVSGLYIVTIQAEEKMATKTVVVLNKF